MGIIDDAECYLAQASESLTKPRDRECLLCYLFRMLGEFGCDNTHRWTLLWRDTQAPRATALLRRLKSRGGCCCDCEVVMNVYSDYLPEDDLTPIPPCRGVSRRGSTEPCRGLREVADW